MDGLAMIWPFKKKEPGENPPQKKENRQFIPNNADNLYQTPKRTVGAIPAAKRAMGLYRDLFLSCPFSVCDQSGAEIKDHWMHDLLHKPAPWLSKSEWGTLLTEHFFLFGNAYFFIQENSERVTGLLPFPPGTCYGYARGDSNLAADNTNPISLAESGIFYETSFKTKDQGEIINRISASKILHFRSLWQNSGDLINGLSLPAQYGSAFELAQNILDCGTEIAERRLISASVLSGVDDTDENRKEDLRTQLRLFFKQGGGYLALPDSIKVNPSLVANPAAMLQTLSTISTLNLSRIFQVPASILHYEDGSNVDSGQSLKESLRFFIRSSGRSWLKTIGDKLGELLKPGHTLKFLWRSFQLSDLRESGVLKDLLEHQIIDEKQAKEWLQD